VPDRGSRCTCIPPEDRDFASPGVGTSVALACLVRQKFVCLGWIGACFLAANGARAQTGVLLAVGDAAQLSELQLAKVMAAESSLWLSMRLEGRTRLALVVAEAAVESAPAADAWLRALDEATRVRIAAPPGPLAGCGVLEHFELADSGMPTLPSLSTVEVSSVSSELDLRRRLAEAGLPVEIERVTRFTSISPPPYRVALYEATAQGGLTRAVRLIDRGHAGKLPQIVISGAKSVPLSLIGLAKAGVHPVAGESADPSEFPVTYRAVDASCDYRAARAGWFAHNAGRWLNEGQASSALFASTVFAGRAQLAPAVSTYFRALSSVRAEACLTQVRDARARHSPDSRDFVCDGADDLARSLSELGFEEPRLTRFFGDSNGDAGAFQVAAAVARGPLLLATDFDTSDCPPGSVLPPIAVCERPSCAPPPVNTPPIGANPPDDPYRNQTPVDTPIYPSDGSCTVSTHDASSRDSCSGDTSPSDASSDSCSGDASASDGSSDSCSGDSSSDEDGPDSCSGDSRDSSADSCGSDSSSESNGCGKSEYDGDTCSGDSSASTSARSTSAKLRSVSEARPRRPRQVRLSLLTLLAAALALPLRRMRAWR